MVVVPQHIALIRAYLPSLPVGHSIVHINQIDPQPARRVADDYVLWLDIAVRHSHAAQHDLNVV
jgi:hypothetical protein